MRGMWQQTLAACAVGLAVMSGLARGADKDPIVVKSGEMQFEEVTEAAPKHPRLHRLRPMAVKERAKEHWQNRTPLACYGNFNDYSCGSIHSELTFLFGSCRQFFGERCLKGPPPYPVPGFDPVAAGIESPGRHGCRRCQ